MEAAPTGASDTALPGSLTGAMPTAGAVDDAAPELELPVFAPIVVLLPVFAPTAVLPPELVLPGCCMGGALCRAGGGDVAADGDEVEEWVARGAGFAV